MSVFVRQEKITVRMGLQSDPIDPTKTRLILQKQRSDGITSSFVAMRTNMLPLYILTHTGGMESVRFKSVSLSTCMPQISCSVEKKRKESHPEVKHQQLTI